MGELRKDYILDRWVIISSKRGKRPHEFKRKKEEVKVKTDYFAPGNEHLTPPEIGRIEKNGKWQIRWFENKFPGLTPEGEAKTRTDNSFFTFASAYGYHEIIVETRDDRQLAELDVDNIKDVLKVYADRINDLSDRDKIKYVNVFKNHGPFAGTSIVHSHSQVMATAFVPPIVRQEVNARRKFIECPYCRIIEIEKNSERRCFENESFVAFCPYASRYNYEVWIFPKDHVRMLHDTDLGAMADIMKKVLAKIHEMNVSYNFALHYSPKGADLHFHLEIYPEIAVWGGFERGTGAIINSVSPEDAASFYRGES